MDNVVTFFSKKPRPVIVNGETIGNEEIEAAMADFGDSRQPREAAARALTVRALLRQRAAALRIEAADEEAAIERLLEQEVAQPAVSDDEVRRYYEGNRAKFTNGDLFQARHILFDTQGGGGKEVVRKAEAILLQLKDHPALFESIAREQSACTSKEVGGELGQLSPGSVVPEFWSALVGFGKAGLLPHLVESRYGHHIVQVDRCVRGQELPFEMVEGQIRQFLLGRREQLAYQGYVAGLIERAEISGVDFGDPTPPGPGLPLE